MNLPKSLTDDEYLRMSCHCKALLQRASHKDGTKGMLCLLLLNTGLRIGEAVQLFATDIIIGTDIVTSLRVRPEIAKGHFERIIPLNEQIRDALAQWFNRHFMHSSDINRQWLFVSSHTGQHITTRQTERIVRKVSYAAFGRFAHPHILRHTFATRLLKVSNTRVVQILLGHQSLQSTQIYTHPDTSEMTKAVNGLNKTQ